MDSLMQVDQQPQLVSTDDSGVAHVSTGPCDTANNVANATPSNLPHQDVDVDVPPIEVLRFPSSSPAVSAPSSPGSTPRSTPTPKLFAFSSEDSDEVDELEDDHMDDDTPHPLETGTAIPRTERVVESKNQRELDVDMAIEMQQVSAASGDQCVGSSMEPPTSHNRPTTEHRSKNTREHKPAPYSKKPSSGPKPLPPLMTMKKKKRPRVKFYGESFALEPIPPQLTLSGRACTVRARMKKIRAMPMPEPVTNFQASSSSSALHPDPHDAFSSFPRGDDFTRRLRIPKLKFVADQLEPPMELPKDMPPTSPPTIYRTCACGFEAYNLAQYSRHWRFKCELGPQIAPTCIDCKAVFARVDTLGVHRKTCPVLRARREQAPPGKDFDFLTRRHRG